MGFWDEHGDLGGTAIDPTAGAWTNNVYEQGGITGNQAPQIDPTRIELPGGAASAPPATAPPPGAPASGNYAMNPGNLFGTVDMDKLANPAGSPKYTALSILQKYPSTPEGFAAAMPELEAAIPGISRGGNGNESLNVPGVGLIHVGGDNIGWRWNPKTDKDGNRVAQQGFDLQGRNLWGAGSPYSAQQQAAFQANGGTWNGEQPGGGGGRGLHDAHPIQTFDGAASSGPGAPPAASPASPMPTYQGPAFTGPDPYSPEAIEAAQIHRDFGGVSEADLNADPSFKFRLNQSLGAMQNSAASKGLLKSGATLKGLSDYAGQAASQEYGNVYGRKYGEYLTNLQTDQYNANNRLGTDQFNASRRDAAAQNNFGNSLAGWQANTNAQLGFGSLDNARNQTANNYSLGMANVGLGYANNALGYHTADQSYDLGLRNNALGYTQAGNAYSLGQGQLGLGWANYGLGADQQNFNQGYSLADLGLRAASQYGNYAGQYGANAGNYATQGGNAAASGTVGSSNAWVNGLNGAANGAIGAYGLYQYGRR
jgi:hypothetical protein